MEESEEEECGLGVERNMKQNNRRKQWEKMSRFAGGGGTKGERMFPAIKQNAGSV